MKCIALEAPLNWILMILDHREVETPPDQIGAAEDKLEKEWTSAPPNLLPLDSARKFSEVGVEWS